MDVEFAVLLAGGCGPYDVNLNVIAEELHYFSDLHLAESRCYVQAENHVWHTFLLSLSISNGNESKDNFPYYQIFVENFNHYAT